MTVQMIFLSQYSFKQFKGSTHLWVWRASRQSHAPEIVLRRMTSSCQAPWRHTPSPAPVGEVLEIPKRQGGFPQCHLPSSLMWWLFQCCTSLMHNQRLPTMSRRRWNRQKRLVSRSNGHRISNFRWAKAGMTRLVIRLVS